MSVYIAEFIGVAIIVFLGCGVLAGNSLKKSGANGAGNVAINLAWAAAVTLAVYTVGDISGGHFNPAVTIAFAIQGTFDWALVPGYLLSQVLGGMFGALLVYLQYLPHWEATEDETVKLTVFVTAPAIRNKFTNFISEFLGTFALVFVVLALGINDFAAGVNPLAVGCLIFVLGTSLGGVTGNAINPARDLGPRIAHFLLPIPGKGISDFKYGWIPVVAPIMGGSLGAMLHSALYEGIVDFRLWAIMIISAITFGALYMISVKNLKENNLSSTKVA